MLPVRCAGIYSSINWKKAMFIELKCVNCRFFLPARMLNGVKAKLTWLSEHYDLNLPRIMVFVNLREHCKPILNYSFFLFELTFALFAELLPFCVISIRSGFTYYSGSLRRLRERNLLMWNVHTITPNAVYAG